jgi:AraC-like DNA-binding protein
MDNFVITEFAGALFSKDAKGRKINFTNRTYSCFIITYKGKVKFTSKNNTVISDCGFSDRTKFFRQFAAYTGMTPLKYRKSKN